MDATNVRATDPDTSHAAAARTPHLRVLDRYRALMAHFVHPDGLTDFELGALIGRQQTSAGKRRGELRDKGFVADSGLRRPAPSGATAIVWCITSAGRRSVMRLPGTSHADELEEVWEND